MSDYIMPIASGFEIAHQLNINKRSEDTFRQGRNHIPTAIFQTLQVYFSIEISTEALKGLNKITHMPFVIRAACMIVPAGMAWLASQQISNAYVRPAINFIHSHIGTLAQVAALASCVALIILGQTAFAVTALVYLALGILERQHLLPEFMRQFLNGPAHVIGDVVSLIVGDPLTKVVAIADLVILCANKWAEYNTDTSIFQPVKHEDKHSPPLTFSDVCNINNSTKFKINKGHVNQHLMPVVPETDIENLVTLCNNFPWEQHLKTLKERLHNDSRWKEIGQFEGEASNNICNHLRKILLSILYGLSKIFPCMTCLKRQIETQEELIKSAATVVDGEKEIHFVKTNVRNCIESVKYKRIYQGEPQSYDLLNYYFKFAAHHLPKQTPQVIADKLISIGLEGGDYCGSGKFLAAAEVFATLMGYAQGIDLKTRVFHVLQQERRRGFDEIYFQYWNNNFALKSSKQLFTPEDVHTYNQMVNLIGTQFGLPPQGAEQDATAIVPPFTKFILSKTMKDYIKIFWTGGNLPEVTLEDNDTTVPSWQFWNRYRISVNPSEHSITGYTTSRIRQVMKEAYGTALMPAAEVTKWWYNWLIAHDHEKDAEQLISGKGGFEQNLQQIFKWQGSRKEIQDRIYNTMFVEMHVLRIRPVAS